MSHPNGYTQEMIKELLGTAWLDKDNIAESGNQIRRRKGNEMRAGLRPYPCLLYTSPSPRDRG